VRGETDVDGGEELDGCMCDKRTANSGELLRGYEKKVENVPLLAGRKAVSWDNGNDC